MAPTDYVTPAVVASIADATMPHAGYAVTPYRATVIVACATAELLQHFALTPRDPLPAPGPNLEMLLYRVLRGALDAEAYQPINGATADRFAKRAAHTIGMTFVVDFSTDEDDITEPMPVDTRRGGQ